MVRWGLAGWSVSRSMSRRSFRVYFSQLHCAASSLTISSPIEPPMSHRRVARRRAGCVEALRATTAKAHAGRLYQCTNTEQSRRS